MDKWEGRDIYNLAKITVRIISPHIKQEVPHSQDLLLSNMNNGNNI